MFLSFIRFLARLFSSISFSARREKLIDEDEKYDLLYNKFKHLVNYEKKLFDSYDNEPQVYSIDVGIPENQEDAWKVIKTIKTGVNYDSVELLSIIDNNLEFSVFEKEVIKILKKTDLDSS